MIGKVLTIAGSDCSGGAGIQADIKTITMHGCYAMSVITSLTAQNTQNVSGIYDIPSEFIAKQLDSVFTDIFPDSVKIGMLSNKRIIEIVAEKLCRYKASSIILDPVMISTSGHHLLADDAVGALVNKLMPIAELVTPNIPEAETFTGIKINNIDDMKKAAVDFSNKVGTSVLVKGGHLLGRAVDILYEYGGTFTLFESERILSENTHGTGCTLSSAIASNLSVKKSLVQSVGEAKEYLSGAISAGLDLGRGNGPLNHFYKINV